MKFALPLLAALALSACGDGGSAGAGPAAAPVAAVPAPAGTSWAETVSKTAEGYRMGNPNAALKLVEYGSRLCPACQNFATESVPQLVERYVATGKLSYEYRDFMIHGVADLPPALLGRCVGEAAFFPVLEQQYRDQQRFTEVLTPALMQRFQGQPPAQVIPQLAEGMGVISYMAQRGLPEAQARACLTDSKAVDALAKQTQDRGNDGTVTGTPTLILNGDKLDSYAWGDVEKAIKQRGG
jgi:protein-disulfide isomerase